MSKQMLWKNAWRAVSASWGRLLALAMLMLISSFTLIGLKITGPDMRATAQQFYRQHQLADLTVSSNYGLRTKDQQVIKEQPGLQKVDFGYFQDSTVKGHQNLALRVFSRTNGVSSYQVTAGHLPKKNNEIAISYLLKPRFRIGQEITLSQHGHLKNDRFRVTGFVRSSEYTDKNDVGQTTVGDGQLAGVAVVEKAAFKDGIPLIARLRYQKTRDMNPYTTRYEDYVTTRKNHLFDQLNKNRAAIYQDQAAPIKAAQDQLNQMKALVPGASQSPTLQRQETQLATAQRKLRQVGYPKYTINDRTNNPGYTIYRSNSERIDILANIFPVFLFAIAAMVSFSTMARFVEDERVSLGTLKALGYDRYDLSKKYTLYSLLASVPGALIGALGGYTLLPHVIFNAYAANSTLANLQLKFSATDLVITLVIALLSTEGAVLTKLWASLKIRPAILLLPKAPQKGARILLERIKPLWRRMSFNYKVTARNVFRYKGRMLMTILGVAGCTALLVMGFGIRDSLQGIAKIQYTSIIRYDMLAVQKPALSSQQAAKLNHQLDRATVKRHQAVYYQPLTKKAGPDQTVQQISMIVPQTTTNFQKSLTLKQRASQRPIHLTNNGVVISEKLATLLNAHVGSKIKLHDANDHLRTFKVAGITEMYMGHFVIMNQTVYRHVFHQDCRANAQLITLRHSSPDNLQNFSRSLIKTGAIRGITLNTNNEQTINNIFHSLDTVVAVLIGIATVLAVVVIYTLTTTNVEERMRELSTLKVLGFYDQEATMYIYRETIFLSVIGILVGYLVGIWLHRFVIINLPPTNAMFDPQMQWGNFAISAAIPAVITFVMVFWVYRRIKTVRMLDALSSVD